MKVGIIGAGAVGSACLLSLIMRGPATEIVLVDRTRKRAEGAITDARYGAVFSPAVRLRAGEYADLAGAALVMITVGVNEKTGGATDRNDAEGRLKLLDTNATIFREVVPQIVKAAPEAVILVVTDPPDPLADVAREAAGHGRVLSTGTLLDSLRFRVHLAAHLNVDPRTVEAVVVGEHGTTEVFLWSSARVSGVPVLRALGREGHGEEAFREGLEKEVRYANITIIEGTGASQLGIGMVSARITEMVLRDERTVVPIGAFNPEYGVTLSLPAVVGREGVGRILAPEMSEPERQGLRRSAEALKKAAARAKS